MAASLLVEQYYDCVVETWRWVSWICSDEIMEPLDIGAKEGPVGFLKLRGKAVRACCLGEFHFCARLLQICGGEGCVVGVTLLVSKLGVDGVEHRLCSGVVRGSF